MNKRKVLSVQHDDIYGIADSLVEAMCPLNQLRRKRAATKDYQEEFVHGYQVSVSNDGVNFSNNTEDIYIFDSTCQSWNNQSGVGMQFSLKVRHTKTLAKRLCSKSCITYIADNFRAYLS